MNGIFQRYQQLSYLQKTLPRFGLALLLSALFHTIIIAVPPNGYRKLTKNISTQLSATSVHKRLEVTIVRYESLLEPLQHAEIPETVSSTAPTVSSITKLNQENLGGDNGEVSRLQTHDEMPLPLPGVIYYPTSILTKRPQPLTDILLEPTDKAQVVATGKMRLKLWISSTGDVHDVILEQSELPPFVAGQVREAFRKAHFSPGEYYGQKVAVVMTIEVSYDDFISR
jgi:hypothetical protein